MPAWAGMGPGMAPSLMRRLDQGEAGLEGRKARLRFLEADRPALEARFALV